MLWDTRIFTYQVGMSWFWFANVCPDSTQPHTIRVFKSCSTWIRIADRACSTWVRLWLVWARSGFHFGSHRTWFCVTMLGVVAEISWKIKVVLVKISAWQARFKTVRQWLWDTTKIFFMRERGSRQDRFKSVWHGCKLKNVLYKALSCVYTHFDSRPLALGGFTFLLLFC